MSTPQKPITTGVDASFVQVVADNLNAKDFHGPKAARVARTVNDALKEVIATAHMFQRLGRRKMLSAEDLECAVKLKGITPPFGFETGTQPAFKYAGNLVRDMYVKEDKEVDLQTFIQQTIPKLPLAPSIKSHWLVIDGEQPTIPENPAPEKPRLMPVQNLPSTSTAEGPPFLKQLGKEVRPVSQVQIKTCSTHPISLEQQIFFREVMEAAMGVDDSKRNEALDVIKSDCGIQLLLPRFSLAIAEGVRCNVAMKNLAFLIYHMRVLQSLNLNKTVNLERVLHEVLPAILTCIVSKTLCTIEKDNHWVLRVFSCRLLASIYNKYTSTQVRVRIVKVLVDVLKNHSNSVTTIAAAATALCELGPEVTQSMVTPLGLQLLQIAQRVQHRTQQDINQDDLIASNRLIMLLKTRVNMEELRDYQDDQVPSNHPFSDYDLSHTKMIQKRLAPSRLE